MTRLTPTHHLLLAQGAQDREGLIDLPSGLRGAAAKAVVAKLMAAGLIAEVFVPAERAWRNDEAGTPVGLTLTPSGRDALERVSEAPAAAEVDESVVAAGVRSNAKRAKVMEMLAWGGGASLDEITAATGWLPHSARAMLSGLRKAGHEVVREKREGVSRYRIPAGVNARDGIVGEAGSSSPSRED
jgi:hypothetical protein